jgi:hypothetical protein
MKQAYLFLFSLFTVGIWFFVFQFPETWHIGSEGRLNFVGLALIAISILVSTLINNHSGGE